MLVTREQGGAAVSAGSDWPLGSDAQRCKRADCMQSSKGLHGWHGALAHLPLGLAQRAVTEAPALPAVLVLPARRSATSCCRAWANSSAARPAMRCWRLLGRKPCGQAKGLGRRRPLTRVCAMSVGWLVHSATRKPSHWAAGVYRHLFLHERHAAACLGVGFRSKPCRRLTVCTSSPNTSAPPASGTGRSS